MKEDKKADEEKSTWGGAKIVQLLFHKRFRKSVPREKVKECDELIRQLSQAIEDKEEQSFLNAHNGKALKGTAFIKKFRLNQSDRILYTMTDSIPSLQKRTKENSLLLIEFATHDDQGVRARNIETNALDFDFTDETLPIQAVEHLSKAPIQVIAPIQVSEYLSALDDEYDVMLNEEQLQTLKDKNSFPLILFGCAGSGKTILCTRFLFDISKSHPDEPILYCSVSDRLNEQVKRFFANIHTADWGSKEDIPSIQYKTFRN